MIRAAANTAAAAWWIVMLAWTGIPRDYAVSAVAVAVFLGSLTGGLFIELAILLWCAFYTALVMAGALKPWSAKTGG